MQKAVFLKGKSATGKSTLMNILACLFDSEDIGVLSKNSEKQFGLEALYDTRIVFCYETGENMNMTKEDFNSIVSKEYITVSRKNKKAIKVLWKPDLICASNTLPKSWQDDLSNAFKRRILFFTFLNKVPEDQLDMNLGAKAARESFLCMVKGNRYYLEILAELGDAELETIMPTSLRKFNEDLVRESKPEERFLLDTDFIQLGPVEEGFYCNRRNLNMHYKRWCSEESLPPPAALDEKGEAFESNGLRARKRSRICIETNTSAYTNTMFIEGAKIVDFHG